MHDITSNAFFQVVAEDHERLPKFGTSLNTQSLEKNGLSYNDR